MVTADLVGLMADDPFLGSAAGLWATQVTRAIVTREERDLVIQSRPLEATEFRVESIRWAYVFYESGLSINVLYTYTLDDKKKRAVGFKLSDGMEVPPELASSFKFAKQKSKLAGTIRGSYFVIKGEY
jgi:hypothetical protein